MNNDEYLKNYKPEKYDKLSLTVDALIFSIINDKLCIRLVKRNKPPFEGLLSLPGTFVKINESLEDAVKRVLKEKAGFSDIYFEQLYTWGDVNRDPRMRIVSVSYISLLSEEALSNVIKKEETDESFLDVDYILDNPQLLAFDHYKIIESARKRLAILAEEYNISFEFLPKEFTLPRLQKITEILLGHNLYKANFRKKIQDKVISTNTYTSGDAFRPSMLYTVADKDSFKV